jgi:type VI secretion system secreted protein VgrG
MGDIGAGVREITGPVGMARGVGEDGCSILYELELRPWSWWAMLNHDRRIFQSLNVVQVSDEVLGKYTYSIEKRLINPISAAAYSTWLF